jgi:hypothetical protein
MLGMMLTSLVGAAQDPRYAEWRLVEAAPETIEYRNALRNGVFDDNARGYLRDVALPQLTLPANKAGIDRVRRRLRDIACDPSGEPRALEQAGQFVIDFMKTIAADQKADTVVRVNAMLIIGDLNAKGGKPLPAALGPLTAAISDGRQPAAVRIAAAAGLARHVQVGDGKLPPPVSAALVKVVTGPADSDPVAAEWLTTRALGMLALLGPTAPPEGVTAAAAILGDAAAATDVRVRAAAVVGVAAADAGVDVATAVTAIRDLATTTLAAEATRDEPLDFSGLRGPEGAGGPWRPGVSGQEGAISSQPAVLQACRRAAWRLHTLATALGGVDGKGGIAARAESVRPEASELAITLREAAMRITEQPDAISLREAFDMLKPAAEGEPAGATATTSETRPDTRPAADSVGDLPFGQ